MNRKSIGPVTLDESEHLLTLRWSLPASIWPTVWGVYLTYYLSYQCVKAYHSAQWAWAALAGIGALCNLIGLLLQRNWHETVIFDRQTDGLRERRMKLWSIGTVTQSEYGPLETMTAEVFQNDARFGVVLRDADANAIEPPMLTRFKTEEQAREVAGILNAFVRQPAPTETPGVWPPPPTAPLPTQTRQ